MSSLLGDRLTAPVCVREWINEGISVRASECVSESVGDRVYLVCQYAKVSDWLCE